MSGIGIAYIILQANLKFDTCQFGLLMPFDSGVIGFSEELCDHSSFLSVQYCGTFIDSYKVYDKTNS